MFWLSWAAHLSLQEISWCFSPSFWFYLRTRKMRIILVHSNNYYFPPFSVHFFLLWVCLPPPYFDEWTDDVCEMSAVSSPPPSLLLLLLPSVSPLALSYLLLVHSLPWSGGLEWSDLNATLTALYFLHELITKLLLNLISSYLGLRGWSWRRGRGVCLIGSWEALLNSIFEGTSMIIKSWSTELAFYLGLVLVSLLPDWTTTAMTN